MDRRRNGPSRRRGRRKARFARKRLWFLCAALALLAAALCLILAGRGGKAPDLPVTGTEEPASLPAEDAPEAPDGIPAPEGDGNAEDEPAEEEGPSEPGEGDTDDAAELGALVTASEAGTFDFDEAYARAARGEETGPLITVSAEGIDPDKLSRWEKPREGFLPVTEKAKTKEKVICITVDDCFKAANIRTITDTAIANGAKVTFFPLGKCLVKETIARAILYAWQNGMEIENHTYSHNHVRRMDQERLMAEIRSQSRALEEALGVSYREHFLRLPGGDERNDQRIHAAAAQQGIIALSHWSVSGSGLGVNACLKKLKPGAIYLFHTTDKDTEKLLSFIPAAVEQGYTPVTLNEMFGLPENETAPLTERGPVPALQPFRITVGYLPNYSHGGMLIQQRLVELGYLTGEPDGIIGEGTREALRSFRADHGMSRKSYWDEETAKALFEGVEQPQ